MTFGPGNKSGRSRTDFHTGWNYHITPALMVAVQLNSTPVVTCDHPFILYL